jgi:hypothetical protein
MQNRGPDALAELNFTRSRRETEHFLKAKAGLGKYPPGSRASLLAPLEHSHKLCWGSGKSMYNPAKSSMAKKKTKPGAPADVSKDLWISPRFALKGQNGDERVWGQRENGSPGSARFLELADIAMGLKKPEPRKKRSNGASAHVTAKTEPYSR